MRTVADLMALPGRQVLLTGGAGHLGLAIGEALVELGATVAIVDKDAAACRERAELLSAPAPGRAVPMPCDLADETAIREAVRTTIRRLGGLDVIIHCAAFVGTTSHPGWAVPFAQQTVDAWDAALRVNLTAPFILAQEAAPALAASGHGAICLVGSIYGLVGPDMRLYDDTPMANPAGYGASKGGVVQLTRHLATLLAPSVRVNCVSPGGVFRHQPESFVQRYIERTPLRRMAGEEDIKAAVAYLVSDASAYVTGHNLVVDGGWTSW
jgi:NAD(P)-dependent dehydrogenase (short-subunit alcohol dehydrogenase family)